MSIYNHPHKPQQVLYEGNEGIQKGEKIMSTEEQIEANRINAKKSTGPKSIIGKERASQNAIKHGLLSKALIVQGEKKNAYEEFRQGVFEDLKPIGMMESLLVDKIVNYAWRLRRAIQAESILLQKGLTKSWEPKTLDSFFEGWEAKKIQNISRYEITIERHFYRSLKELRETQALRREEEKPQADLLGFGFVS